MVGEFPVSVEVFGLQCGQAARIHFENEQVGSVEEVTRYRGLELMPVAEVDEACFGAVGCVVPGAVEARFPLILRDDMVEEGFEFVHGDGGTLRLELRR